METPYLTHLQPDDYKYVYEPAEDSFLLLDAIEADLPLIFDQKPKICLEIGSGSGVVITALAKVLPECMCYATDINPMACRITKKTANCNNAVIEMLNMDLTNGFRSKEIDLLIFNPPYVVTSNEELESKQERSSSSNTSMDGDFNTNIIKSWAGGVDGRVVMDRVFSHLDEILAPAGVAYILVIKDNKPAEIIENLEKMKFQADIVKERRIRGEHLLILKIQRAI